MDIDCVHSNVHEGTIYGTIIRCYKCKMTVIEQREQQKLKKKRIEQELLLARLILDFPKE